MVNSYIIHLERSTQRKPLVQDLLASLPNAQVMPAVEGKLLSDDDVAATVREKIYDPKYPFGLMPGEMGCFLSHRNVWEAVVQGDADHAIVCEDDTILGNEFEQTLQLALETATTDSLIRFPIKNREVSAQAIASQGDIQIFRPKVIGLTTTMYVIGRGAAKRLLDEAQLIDRPIDTWLQMRWETGVDSHTIWPSHISAAPADFGGSTIQKKQKSLRNRLRRSIDRSIYRSAITRKSKTS